MAIYWVSEDLDADVSTGTTGDVTDPFGIQYAMTNAGADDEVRLMDSNYTGTGYAGNGYNYDSRSNSWNNRTDATKQLTSAGGGLYTQKITSGWINPTTRGEVTLDFENTASGNGIVATSGSYQAFVDIHVDDAEGDGFDAGVSNEFVRCRASNCGGDGFDGNLYSAFMFCRSHANGGNGYDTNQTGRAFRSEAHDNTGDGFTTSHYTCLVECIADDNGDDGFVYTHWNSLFGCLAYSNTGDGAYGASGGVTVYANNGFVSNGGYGIQSSSGRICVEINSGLYGNTSGGADGRDEVSSYEEGEVLTDPSMVDPANRDFSPGANWIDAGAGALNSGLSSAVKNIGPVRNADTGGGGSGGIKLVGHGGGLVG